MPQPSEQYQNLTISTDGRNVMPLLQPKSHFFLQDGNFTQTEANRFGAITENQFRTTSSIAFTGDKSIYTLCQGTVFLQPQTGNDNKINLILRPFKQPINGINIKYIIYRGLNKSNFITANGIIAGSESSGSSFVQHIWTEFKEFYENLGIPKPVFSSNFIGFPFSPEQLTAQEETHLMDQYFFKITNFLDDEQTEENPILAYELPIIPRGINLGTATDSLGIDIVLNTGDYYIENDSNPFQFNLIYARASNYSLDASSITDNFEKKVFKENVVKFMDIAAFYGLHANGAGKVYLADDTTPKTTKEDIYTLMNGFYSKNKIYLYIQGNRQRSYNFYDNYNISLDNVNNIKTGNTINSLSETTFGTFNWPIHELTTVVSDPVESTSVVLQVTTDNYENAAMNVQVGRIVSEHEENFIRNKNLLQDDVDEDNTFIKPLIININATPNSIIASYISILCEARQMVVKGYVPVDNPDAEPQDLIVKDIDDVFGLLDVASVNISANEMELPTIVDEKLQIINFPNAYANNNIGVIKHQKTEDRMQTVNEDVYVNRVTYETLMYDIKPVVSPYVKSSSPHLDSTKTSMQTYVNDQNNFYQPKLPYLLKFKSFNDGVRTITSVLLKTSTYDDATKKIVGIIKDELNILKQVVVDNLLINSKIFFKNTLTDEENDFISLDNVNYKQYKIGVIGEDTDGRVKIYFPTDDIFVYTVDSFVYTSFAYGEHILFNYEKEFYANLIN